MSEMVDLVVIAVLFAFAVLVSHETPRRWMIQAGGVLVTRFTRPEQPSEWELEQAELWLMARRRQLVEDLGRIERLLLHDKTMSATRQLGNRLARDQLLASIARLPEVLPGRDRWPARARTYEVQTYDRAAPSPALSSREPVAEVLDVSGWRG